MPTYFFPEADGPPCRAYFSFGPKKVELGEEAFADGDADLQIADLCAQDASKVGNEVMLYRHTPNWKVDQRVGKGREPIIEAGTATNRLQGLSWKWKIIELK